ncbi:DUF2917 domain-containing protein [Noviherbaspirillum sp. ST9]|uniref:DUF2917 domain-containing protein n=1 Tax=Noviherbaspirillum sp. ST9 TaxID=3401606 RepID=UPI003B587855
MSIAARMDFTGLTSGFAARAAAPEPVVMKLEPYRAASLHARGPVAVTCLSGQLWITLPGELEDIVLRAGQSRVLNTPVQDIVLSTAGARCPATFGIRSVAETAKRRIFGGGRASPFRVEFD